MRDVILLAMVLFIAFVSIMTWHKENLEKLLAQETDRWVDITVQEIPTQGAEDVADHIAIRKRESDFKALKRQPRIEYTPKELKELEWLVMEEHGGHSFDGQLLTASVIINRVLDERFPGNLHDVIYQQEPVWQFTPVARGLLGSKEVTRSVKTAVHLALREDYADGAWMFNVKNMTSEETQKWFEKFEIVAEIDGTQFRK